MSQISTIGALALCFMFNLTYGQGTFQVNNTYSSLTKPATSIQNFAGHQVCIGSSYNGTNGSDIYINHINDQGTSVFAQYYGTTASEYANDIIQLPDSGYAVAGYMQTSGFSSRDLLLIRFDKNNNILWSKTFGGNDMDQGIDLVYTADSSLCVVGSSLSYGTPYESAYVVKVDLNGNLHWARRFAFSYETVAYSVVNAADNHITLCGKNSIYALFLKLNLTLGTVMESRRYQGSPGSAAAYDLVLTSDDGYMIAGETSGFGAGVKDVSLLKVNDIGDVQWNNAYGGFYDDEQPRIQKTSSGYLISASTESFGSGLKDAWLFSVGNTGALQWSTTFGNAYDNTPLSVTQTQNNEILVYASSQTSATSGIVDELIKTNLIGVTSCMANYVSPTVTTGSPSFIYNNLPSDTLILTAGSTVSLNTGMLTPSQSFTCAFSLPEVETYQKVLGSAGLDVSYGLDVTFDGGCYVSGTFASGPNGLYDFVVSRLNGTGDTVWTKVYGGNDNDYCDDLITTPDGGAIIVGNNSLTVGGYKTFALRIDQFGNIIWFKRYDFTDVGAVIQTSDGNYAISGRIGAKMGVLKFAPDGNLIWGKTYVDGTANGLAETDQGDIVVVGYDNGSVGSRNLIVLKVSESGNFIKAKSFEATAEEIGSAIICNGNDYYVCGQSSSYGGGFSDALIIKMDSSLTSSWAYVYGGSSYDDFWDACLVNGNLMLIGDYQGTFLGSIALNGDVNWGKRYSTSGTYSPQIKPSYDGGFVLLSTSNQFSNGSFDLYVVKTDSAGHAINCYETDLIPTKTSASFTTTILAESGSSISTTFTNAISAVSGINLYKSLEVGGTYSITDVSCSGGSNGAIDFSPNGGIAPYNFTWSNLSTTEDISGLTAGIYDVIVSDNLGCTFNDTIQVNEPLPLTIGIVETDATCFGLGDGSASATVTGGTSPYNYLWNVGQQSPTALGLFAGSYILNVVDANGCLSSGLAMVSEPSPINMTFSVLETTCGAADGVATVLPSGGTPSYSALWNGSIPGTTLNNAPEGYHQVSIVDANGCVGSDSVYVGTGLDGVDICIITVDTSSSHNLIVWEKPPVGHIEGFKIYRNIAGVYSAVGFRPYDSLSQFIDPSFGVDPNITSYRYKLTTIDTCGNESDLSPFHETMHLTANVGISGEVNLIWDNYEGFGFNYYRILRDSTGSNNWEVIDSVSNFSHTYTDLNLPSTGAVYQIEVVAPSTCTSTRASHNTTRSNKSAPISGGGSGNGIDDYSMIQLNVFPNPFNHEINIRGLLGIKNCRIEILDQAGRVVMNKTGNISQEIFTLGVSDLPVGVYHLRVLSGLEVLTNQKIVRINQ